MMRPTADANRTLSHWGHVSNEISNNLCEAPTSSCQDLSVCLSVGRSVPPSVRPSVGRSVGLSVCRSVCLPACLSAGLSVIYNAVASNTDKELDWIVKAQGVIKQGAPSSKSND